LLPAAALELAEGGAAEEFDALEGGGAGALVIEGTAVAPAATFALPAALLACAT
jgi:hypothetical protein